ncbi:MAG: hypothetical protein ACI4J7_06485, partial [Ruminiclostridium sp.]
MENYKYKVVVELDDSVILSLGRHDLEDTYRVVKLMFTEEGLHDVSERKRLIFISRPGEKDAFGAIGAVTNTLYRCWAKPYLNRAEQNTPIKTKIQPHHR